MTSTSKIFSSRHIKTEEIEFPDSDKTARSEGHGDGSEDAMDKGYLDDKEEEESTTGSTTTLTETGLVVEVFSRASSRIVLVSLLFNIVFFY